MKAKYHVYNTSQPEILLLTGYLKAHDYSIIPSKESYKKYDIWRPPSGGSDTDCGFVDESSRMHVDVESNQGRELDALLQKLDIEKLKETLRDI